MTLINCLRDVNFLVQDASHCLQLFSLFFQCDSESEGEKVSIHVHFMEIIFVDLNCCNKS